MDAWYIDSRRAVITIVHFARTTIFDNFAVAIDVMRKQDEYFRR